MLRLRLSLGDGADAAAVFLHRRLHVFDETVERERNFGKIDEMRTVVGAFAGERARRREEAGVASHDDVDLDAAERAVVEIVALQRRRHESRGAAEARRMVAAAQIAVDRLGDVVDDERITGLLRLFGDDSRGIGGIIAADVVEVADVQLLELLKNPTAILARRLQAAAAERRGRRRGDGLELFLAHLAKVDVVALQDARDTVPRAKNPADLLRRRILLQRFPEKMIRSRYR